MLGHFISEVNVAIEFAFYLVLTLAFPTSIHFPRQPFRNSFLRAWVMVDGWSVFYSDALETIIIGRLSHF